MTGSGPAPVTGVSGGSADLAATYEAVLALATAYDVAGTGLRRRAALGARVLSSDDLLESAVLSSLTFAEAEAAVVSATTGPDGVLVESIGWEADAVLVRTTVRVLRETDELVHATFEALDRMAGRAAGFTLSAGAVAVLPEAVVLGSLALVAWPHLPKGVRRDVAGAAAGAGRDLEAWATEHPAAVQHLVNGGGGLLEGLWDGLTPLTPGGPLGIPLLTPDTESGAAVLAALYGEEGPVRVEERPDLGVPGAGTQPAGVAGLVSHLGEVASLSDPEHPQDNGTIEVQTITGSDGSVRHVVYLPGTDDMGTLPWTRDHDVRDMCTNLLLVAGEDNAHADGVLQAMEAAGIRPDEPVLLAGHSQGGMEAAAILSRGSDFHITNVVTAGSPTAQVDGFPPGSHVLSLEQRGDVVPLLDGEDNPDSVEQVTVRFDDGGTGVLDSHSYPHYVAGAAAVDASRDQSVAENVRSMRDRGFLGEGARVTSRVFQLTRGR